MTQKETVAYYLKNKAIEKALAFAKDIKQFKNKVVGLEMIFQQLQCTQEFEQALEVVKLMPDNRRQTLMLQTMVSQALARQAVEFAHQVAQKILTPRSQSSALKQVADHYLQLGKVNKALAIVVEIKTIKTQVNLLKGVSERLIGNNLTEALLAAEQIKDIPVRLQLIEKLTKQILTQYKPNKVLEVLIHFKNALSKIWVWTLVSTSLPKKQSSALLGEALAMSNDLQRKYEKALGITQVAFYIAKLLGYNSKVDKLLAQAVTIIEKIWKDTEKLQAMEHLVSSYIKMGRWSKALDTLECSVNRIDVPELLQRITKTLDKSGYANEATRLKQATASILARTIRSQRSKKLIKVSNEKTKHRNSYYYYSYEDDNKFYYMTDNEDGTFTAEYGRIGEPGTNTYTYPIEEWTRKYKEKLRKGYKDVTYIHQTDFDSNSKNRLEIIALPSIIQLVQSLQAYAQQSVNNNYVVNAQNVSLVQLEKAQMLIDEISGLTTLLNKGHDPRAEVDQLLLQLFTVIPRKMDSVEDYLTIRLENNQDVMRRVLEEQATLDVMRGEVLSLQNTTSQTQAMTLTDSIGVKIEAATLSDVMAIRQLMGNKYFDEYFQQAYKVTHLKSQALFDTQVSDAQNRRTKLLWHGSRNENWWSILKTGLVLRPANAVVTGKMFGYGLYFADKVKKSMGYSSLYGSFWTSGESNKAYLAVYDVHLGNCMRRKQHEYWMYDLDEVTLKGRGNYDSLFARGGADLINNEYIVYKETQCTIKYLIEIHS
ncbi:hypothetical protein [uncultured Microscilla sp.]|uniref:hypothetical protein n=1 Tax=uncultured Microscilla sp. TaxID=432653 RepID=UPI00261242B9|nr:hypothetical protein [uncultured Microscilla sp.]